MSALACSEDPAPTETPPEPVLADDPGSEAQAEERNLGFPDYSIDAKHDTYEMMRADLETERHPSDGKGRAWIVSASRANGEPGPLRSEDLARIEIIYEAGPLGIEVDGELQLVVSPFWQWDPPQNVRPNQRGYTQVRTQAEGVRLLPEWHGNEVLAIGIGGRKLAAGERVEIVYGAGSQGARIDLFAEREERMWLAIDGNGDGVREFLADSPRLDIVAASASRLMLALPTTLRPGEAFEAVVSLLDRHGNSGVAFEGRVEIDVPDGIELPREVVFRAEDEGHKRVPGLALEQGIYRLNARAFVDGADSEPPLVGHGGPIVVEEGIAHVRWADLHGHSQLSDGTGTPEDYFRYARDIAALDIVSLTDHDHWGVQFLDKDPAIWQRIKQTVADHNEPGSFVTVLGYEWTSWLHGHRHVLYFEDDGEVYSSLDPRYQKPSELWDALRGQKALTFAHHSAGGPISTNWAFPPDPVLEPLTEVVSVHGSSESIESPSTIYNPVEGNFVRDVLMVGYRLGFIGSGDGHDGHPGLSHVSNDGGGGLAAIFVEDLDRDSVLATMRARHTYATNGARIFVEVSIDGYPMGSFLPAAVEGDSETQMLKIRAIGEGPLNRVDVVRSGVMSRVTFDGDTEWTVEREIPRLRSGEFHYIRVVEESGAVAWTSPIFAN
ncbi:MAG: CehA/McbA family metallohydrolase [bacterium]|nr:CehA/McbA family metallohydrolase [bacterium]